MNDMQIAYAEWLDRQPEHPKDGGPKSSNPEDVPVRFRCVAGPPMHDGACRNAAGEQIPDPIRDIARPKGETP